MTLLPVPALLVLALLAWLLLPGRLPGPAPIDAPRSLRGPALDLLLFIVCGAGLAAANSLWFARFGLYPQPFLCTDFHEYCGTIAGLVLDAPADMSAQRSPLTAAISAAFVRRLGMVDGMAVAALLSTGVIGGSLYLWGRALHGRLAGLLAAMAATTFVPVVSLSRTLSFYPELAAAFTFGAATTALALRFRTPLSLFMAGVGIGACVLVEGRGLFWALPFFGLSALAALWPRAGLEGLPNKLLEGLACCFALALPLYGAWVLGQQHFGIVQCLEVTIDPATRMRDHGFQLLPPARELPPRGCYTWGQTSLLRIPETLHWIWAMTRRIPPEAFVNDEIKRNLILLLGPLPPTIIGAAVLSVLGTLRGRHRMARLMALLGTAVPFLAALSGAIRMQRAQLHYLSTPGPLLVLVLGVGLAVAFDGLDGLPGLADRWRRLHTRLRQRLPPAPALPGDLDGQVLLRSALALGLGFLLVTGILPTDLSPVAPWRVPITHGIGDIQATLYARGKGPRAQSSVPATPSCYELLEAEQAAGKAVGGTLFGGVPTDAKSAKQDPPPGGWGF